MPPPPPVPFADFDFTFDTSFLPTTDGFGLPSAPSGSDLLAPEESATLLGFLDNFSSYDFPMSGLTGGGGEDTHMLDSMSGFSLQPPPPPASLRVNDGSPVQQHSMTANPMQLHPNPMHNSSSTMAPSQATSSNHRPASSSSTSEPSQKQASAPSSSTQASASRKKAPVPSSQKRLNHIASEQKRRNMIRDGYATLTTILAPAGTRVENALPRRGRPRGSGARGRGLGKGKSGVLFRAVEYIAWLQENCDGLEEEIARVEAVPPSVR
ncbi:hypothetical protein BKA62DRAFT_611169 [Auriculariales sp. MPI-PUGE-AT-0066]|nr:hypothetical protein BKA62DRAFT_611169 [Auriculariales sp. MPI-PUGE-AT-0066]